MIIPQATSRKDSLGDDSVLPMINVVFLLLIFFMITGQASSDAELQSPESISTTEQQSGVVIRIDAEGLLSSADGALSLTHIPNFLAASSASRIELNADARVDSDRVMRVIDTLQQAGAHTVVLRTRHP